MLVVGDRIFRTGRAGTAEATETGEHEITGISWLTSVGDTYFALQQGALVQSTDAETFTPVTPPINFSELGSAGDTLVALRGKSFGVAELFISKDKGMTWTLLQEVTAGYMVGTMQTRGIGRDMQGRVGIGMGVQDDSFGNVNFASQGYEFTAATGEVKLVSSTKDKLTGPTRPQYVSKDGIAFFNDNMNVPTDQQGDATHTKVIINPSDTPDLKTARLLRWAKPALPFDSTADLMVLGQDSTGRLLVWADRIYRSKNPLTAEDEHAQVLKGPGCDTRHSFTPDLKNDDNVKVTFQNKTGLKVILRYIDNQLRWQRLKELDVGEEVIVSSLSNNASKENVRLMVSDPADETCLGVYVVPQGPKESTIVANKP